MHSSRGYEHEARKHAPNSAPLSLREQTERVRGEEASDEIIKPDSHLEEKKTTTHHSRRVVIYFIRPPIDCLGGCYTNITGAIDRKPYPIGL